MNENNRGTPLWLTIGIAVCVSLLSIAAYQWDCSGNIPDIAEASDGCRYVP